MCVKVYGREVSARAGADPRRVLRSVRDHGRSWVESRKYGRGRWHGLLGAVPHCGLVWRAGSVDDPCTGSGLADWASVCSNVMDEVSADRQKDARARPTWRARTKCWRRSWRTTWASASTRRMNSASTWGSIGARRKRNLGSSGFRGYRRVCRTISRNGLILPVSENVGESEGVPNDREGQVEKEERAEQPHNRLTFTGRLGFPI
jgi:hypothetical protein